MALSGAVTVVTGGGRGIGRAIACALGGAGASVAICARTQAELDESAKAIHQAGGGQVDVLAVRCDVASSESVAAFADAVRERLGTPRVLVNNAGLVLRGRLDRQDVQDWYEVIDVNLLGTYNVTRAFLGDMRAARSGRIINISSISGRLGTALHTAYCAAKHGVVGLTRALAEVVRADGVQVNAICPGSVDTRMLEGSGFKPDMTPEDVARVALFLAERAPDALTGACLDVFG
jgi:NAD(P)-dependent dehydrogenase (short-subunit alcohol dehydrogenase family)